MEYYGKAGVAKITNEEKQAKEKLELVLTDLGMDKRLDSNYNEEEYINTRIEEQEGMKVLEEDIVLVDGWKFKIDRTVPKIGERLGQGELNQNITIEITKQINNDYTKSKLVIKVKSEVEIKQITLNGQEIELPEKTAEGEYIYEIEVTENKKYTVIATDKNDKINVKSEEITDITKDIEIWNKADMEKFRDEVNNGRTFEGKTVKVMQDIDLQGNDSDQWVPIKKFNGTFEGNYHKIKNLYIKSGEYHYLGLFSEIRDKSIIQNTVLENVTIENFCKDEKSGYMTGGIAGYTKGKILNCGINSGSIKAYKTATSNDTTYKMALIAGIVGYSTNEISGCYNKANIEGEHVKQKYNNLKVGGIVGEYDFNKDSAIISNCYNMGNLKGNGYDVVVGGVIAQAESGKNKEYNVFSNCYNIGKLTGSGTIQPIMAGIIGRNGYSTTQLSGKVSNNYCTTTSATYSYNQWNGSSSVTSQEGKVGEETLKGYHTKLGNAYLEDKDNINNGYPILAWQQK